MILEPLETDQAQEWKIDLVEDDYFLIEKPVLAKDIQNWILATSIRKQPALALAATLSILSCAYGRSLLLDGIKPNLMLLCLANSGEGKDWPMKAAKKLLAHPAINMQARLAGQVASGAALIEAISHSRSLLMILDEIGHYFSGISSGKANQYSREIMPMITELYTSANDTYIGKATKGNKGIVIESPHLSIFGCATERQFIEPLSSAEVLDGSLARFFVFFGKNNVELNKKRVSADIPDHIIDELAYRINKHQSIFPANPLQIVASDAFMDEKDLIQDINDARALNDAFAAPIYRRNAVKAVQVAMLINPDCDDVKVLEWASRLVTNTSECFIKKFKHMAADNENERQQKIIIAAIKEAGKRGISARDLTRKTQRVSSVTRKQVIKELLDVGLIFLDEVYIDHSQKATLVYFWKK